MIAIVIVVLAMWAVFASVVAAAALHRLHMPMELPDETPEPIPSASPMPKIDESRLEWLALLEKEGGTLTNYFMHKPSGTYGHEGWHLTLRHGGDSIGGKSIEDVFRKAIAVRRA